MKSIDRLELGIVNYGASNKGSIFSALSEIGAKYRILQDAEEISNFNGSIVIPGVGAFGAAIDCLNELSIKETIKDAARRVPILGICLGMQILMDSGTENGIKEGLGLLRGKVVRLEPKVGSRVPNIGWRTITPINGFGLDSFRERFFYFCHSYYVQPTGNTSMAAFIEWGEDKIPAIVCDESKSIWGIQFHPEKSGNEGLKLLQKILIMMNASG